MIAVADDTYRMDSHKLMFHPREVVRWLKGDAVYPLYVEISPSGACNHRCRFCALDFMGYESRFLETTILKERITELAAVGVKSIMYAGEGEPLLHPDIAEIVIHTREVGIDVAVTTNGTLLGRAVFSEICGSLSWLRVSLNAGCPETYAGLHRTRPDDFDTVVGVLSTASEIIRATEASCTLGVQMVLLPENAGEAVRLASIVKAAGAHYFSVKPHSQHPGSRNREYEKIDYAPFMSLSGELASLADDSFHVIFRTRAMDKTSAGKRGYDRCNALPFWSYIDAGGSVWGCSSHLGDRRFWLGNIVESRIKDIWQGDVRKNFMVGVAREFNPSLCRVNCRMDEVNRYLWDLAHPTSHVNFI